MTVGAPQIVAAGIAGLMVAALVLVLWDDAGRLWRRLRGGAEDA